MGIRVLIGMYAPTGPTFWPSLWSVIGDVIPSLIASSILFAMAYLFFKEARGMRTRGQHEAPADDSADRPASALEANARKDGMPKVQLYENVRHVPWGEIIGGASTVDICVHFWGRWLIDNSPAFQGLFEAGGTVRLVLPNPGNAGLIKAIKSRFPEHDEGRLASDIRDTRDRLFHLVGKSNHERAKAEVYFSDKLTWYCGVRCDLRYLILSLYEHARELRTESPTFFVDIGANGKAGEWFDREFGDLMQVASAKEIHPKGRKAR